MTVDSCGYIDDLRRRYPEKFVPLAGIFRHIHRGDHIFISTGCGEPQYMVNALTEYVKKNPKAFFDTEVLHMWTLEERPTPTRTIAATSGTTPSSRHGPPAMR